MIILPWQLYCVSADNKYFILNNGDNFKKTMAWLPGGS